MKGAITTAALAIATAALIVALLGDTREISFLKPFGDGIVWVNYSPAPKSPGEMVREAAAVIVAKYTGKQRLLETRREFAVDHVYSIKYEFEILETLKSDPLLPSGDRARLDIDLSEEERRTATHVMRTRLADAAPLRPDRTYVVFLARNSVRPELYLAWVADGLYDVTAASVEPVNRRNRRHENLSAKAFLDILRQASR